MDETILCVTSKHDGWQRGEEAWKAGDVPPPPVPFAGGLNPQLAAKIILGL